MLQVRTRRPRNGLPLIRHVVCDVAAHARTHSSIGLRRSLQDPFVPRTGRHGQGLSRPSSRSAQGCRAEDHRCRGDRESRSTLRARGTCDGATRSSWLRAHLRLRPNHRSVAVPRDGVCRWANSRWCVRTPSRLATSLRFADGQRLFVVDVRVALLRLRRTCSDEREDEEPHNGTCLADEDRATSTNVTPPVERSCTGWTRDVRPTTKSCATGGYLDAKPLSPHDDDYEDEDDVKVTGGTHDVRLVVP